MSKAGIRLNQLLRGMKTLAERVLEKRRFGLWEIRWVYLLVCCDVLLANRWICKCVTFSSRYVRNGKKIYDSLWCRSIANNYYICLLTFINNHVGNTCNWINCCEESISWSSIRVCIFQTMTHEIRSNSN